MRSYLMVYHDAFFSFPHIERWADASPLVTHWRHDTPGCVYLLSERSAAEIARDFRSKSHLGEFIVLEVAGQVAGRMLPETYTLLTEKSTLYLAGGPHRVATADTLQPVG